jgi:hypothetical protein
MVQKPPIQLAMHMPFHLTTTLGALEANVQSYTNLPGHGENKDVFIPKTDESYE